MPFAIRAAVDGAGHEVLDLPFALKWMLNKLEFHPVTPRVRHTVWGEREVRGMYGFNPGRSADEAPSGAAGRLAMNPHPLRAIVWIIVSARRRPPMRKPTSSLTSWV